MATDTGHRFDVTTVPAAPRLVAGPRLRQALVTAATVISVAACGRSDQGAGAGDSAAAGGATAAASAGAMTPAPSDTAMGGMDHSAMAMNRPAPRDSNQVFLRMMSDHHEGLIALADSAQPRLQGATAKSDAQTLRRKQDEEQTRMLSMLSRQYGDSVTPMILPSNRAMMDSILRAPQGADADRVFYRQVIAHHEEGVHQAEMHLPHLKGEVKQMAERMRTEQRREIRELERKAGGAGQGGR